jgi:hypothetical protein
MSKHGADGYGSINRPSEPEFGRGGVVHKTKIVGLLALASLVLAFAFIASAPAASNANGLPAAAAATPAEQHPEIHNALAALRNAKGHLEHAAHDFGGHRAEALKATEEAIHQLEICLKYDK